MLHILSPSPVRLSSLLLFLLTTPFQAQFRCFLFCRLAKLTSPTVLLLPLACLSSLPFITHCSLVQKLTAQLLSVQPNLEARLQRKQAVAMSCARRSWSLSVRTSASFPRPSTYLLDLQSGCLPKTHLPLGGIQQCLLIFSLLGR